jgi:cyclopropane-fatty-acyl-phospholipid synthase
MARVLADRSMREERARAAVISVHEELRRQGWNVPARLWDGTELGPSATGYRLCLNHPWSLRALLVPPTSRAAGEAYLHDDIDVEGSMVSALRDVALARDALGTAAGLGAGRRLLRLPAPPRRDPSRRLRLSGRLHSLRRDRQAVQFHYDVGNDFYRLFLDADLVYSCAYFADDDPVEWRGPGSEAALAAGAPVDAPEERDARLDRAQQRKLDLVCRKLDLRRGERLLDVGCGWGALVIHAARTFGVRALGVTLSEEQCALARERVERLGLEGRVEIRLADYREVSDTFDAIASVGMVEHVGAGELGSYFGHLHRLTAPGGRLLNHGITTGRRGVIRDMSRDPTSFVGAYVFPDGALVPARTAVAAMEEAGYELLDVHQLRPHYALTLAHWVDRLERHATEARALAGDVVYRTWRVYMAGSHAGFASGDLGVIQVVGGKDARMPLGRTQQLPAY